MLIFIYLFYFVFYLTGLSLASDCKHTNKTLKCLQYVSNYDGDTIKFNIPNLHSLLGKEISIRLNDIDTPEIRGKTNCEKEKAKRAKNFVYKKIMDSDKIELKNFKRGKYFRIVGDLYIDDVNLSELLIINHLAVPYNGKTKPQINWCNN